MVREILHAVSRAVEQLVAQRFGAAVEDVVDVERFGLAEAVVGRPGIGQGSLFAGRFQPFEIGFETYAARRARRGVHVADDELRRAFAGDASHPFDVEPGAFEPGRFADVLRKERTDAVAVGTDKKSKPARFVFLPPYIIFAETARKMEKQNQYANY